MADVRKQLELISKANAAADIREQNDQLARKALELRQRGKSWFQIAETLKTSEVAVRNMASESIAFAADLVSTATRQELLAIEMGRLDHMQDSLWDDATAGDTRAVDSILRIITLRSKLLGLDEQVQTGPVRAVVVQGVTEEYVAALAAINAGGLDEA